VWLKPMPLYALGPIEGLRIRRLIDRMERFVPPASAPTWSPVEGVTEPPPATPEPSTHPAAEPAGVA